MKIKTVCIFANSTKLNDRSILDEMKSFFASKNITVKTIFLSSAEDDLKIKKPKCDLAVSLGGDGTVLTCAYLLNKTDIPILAVNLGTFGYITGTSINEYKEVFESYIEGKTEAELRMRLSVVVKRHNRKVFESSALNEVTVLSASRSKACRYNLAINRKFAASLKGDGIIIATPTGSTAYNLSAGGPILEETLNNIIINPLCSFTLSARPLVVDEKSEITVSVPVQTCKTALSCDGHEAFVLEKDDVVYIQKSRYSTKLVKNNARNSIEVLRDKLGWAGGFNA